MAIVTTDNKHYTDIADAIRNKGVSGSFTPAQMSAAIGQIEISGGEDPMSGSFTLPAPITRVAGLFRGTTLPETFTLNLPNTCTYIGTETAGSEYQLFRGVLGMKHLQINGSALTYDDGAITNNSVIEDVTYNDGTTEITLADSSPFLRCGALKSINAVLVCAGISSGNNAFAWTDNIENIRFKSNLMTFLRLERWRPDKLTNASIISLCNALKQGKAATATFTATLKNKLSTIYGTVDSNESFPVFIETGVTSDITLADFVTNTRGWTVA